MYDARQIANWFILRAQKDDKKLSIMQLLKLVYIAHGWHLEMRRFPLVLNKIEAWRRGPVIRDVYNTYRPQGIYVSNISENFPALDDPDYHAFLDGIYTIYGDKSPFELSDMTHVPGGPWDQITKAHGLFAQIPDSIIQQHYDSLRQQRLQ